MSFKYKYLGYKEECKKKPISFLPQHQNKQPGLEYLMNPPPIFDDPNYKGSNKLTNKVSVITGGDSGIGRAISVAFAKEGSHIVIVYLDEHKDAIDTKNYVESLGRKCILFSGDIKDEKFCSQVIENTISKFGHLDILVNNAGVQYPQNKLEDISSKQLEDTLRTNIFSMFYLTKAALKYLKRGSKIINTASVTAYKGHKLLIDYSATKGAIVTFTRSLALSLISQGINVNAVAPGPIWTPLQPSSFSAEYITTFGTDTPIGRAGQPVELAPAYVYLASDDSTYVTGEVLHINGGSFITS